MFTLVRLFSTLFYSKMFSRFNSVRDEKLPKKSRQYVAGFLTVYQSTASFYRSLFLSPIITWENRLACCYCYDTQLAYLSQKYIYVKKHEKKYTSHNTHSDTQCSKNKGLLIQWRFLNASIHTQISEKNVIIQNELITC